MGLTRKMLEPFPNYTTHVMRSLGMEPDPWQAQVLEGDYRRLLLNCSRLAGKSTVVAVLTLVEAILVPDSLVLLLAPSLRQSTMLFKKISTFYKALGARYKVRLTIHELELENGSQIVSLPCEEGTIRGYSGVTILVIDEAARVPDDLYRAVRPMLATTDGRLICLSTPHGRRGFFYKAWARGGPEWTRIEVPASKISRIKPETIEEDRQELGESYIRQEYFCSFEALEGLVYPDFAKLVGAGKPDDAQRAWAYGKKVGGIDFGFRDPFAAVWGVLDPDGVLWLTGEHYCRARTLPYHAQQLPPDVLWAADPSRPGQIRELLNAGLKVRKAYNDRELGMAALRARLERGALRLVPGRCPNLLLEAEVYRHDDAGDHKRREDTTEGQDHAMDALRYLVMMLDRNKVARFSRLLGHKDVEPPPAPESQAPPPPRAKNRWLSIHNEALWTPICTITRGP